MNRTKYGDNAKIPKTRLQQSVQGQGAVQGEANVELETVQDHGAVQTEADVQLEVSLPVTPTRESILQDSPIRVTRSRLAMLLGDGQIDIQSPPKNTTPKKMLVKKLTPRKLKKM